MMVGAGVLAVAGGGGAKILRRRRAIDDISAVQACAAE